MSRFDRDDLYARYELFQYYGLTDQRKYYQSVRDRYRTAAGQVNFLRALIALLTGMCAAAAGLITQYAFIGGGACTFPDDVPPICGTLTFITAVLTILAVVLPAIGALFNNLSDLYQWDRLADVFERAQASLEVADALSPLEDDPNDESYAAALRAYAEGALAVMSDETAQWGQSIRTPDQIEQFVEMEKKKVESNYAEFLKNFDITPKNPPPDEGDSGAAG